MKSIKAKAAQCPSVSSSGATRNSKSRNPEPEIVLLAVTGKSPAVLTETLWALAGEPEPVLPSRVVVVTTTDGRDELTGSLFRPLDRFGGLTPWQALRNALEARGFDLDGRLRFGVTADDVRVITAFDRASGQSRELSDIRAPSDNEAAADFLLDQIRGFVENPDTMLIASMAGGRKTMGALLYACMTLAGRESDRLTHVLVEEPYETLREFYFPGQPGGSLQDRQGQPHGPETAQVDLADVTFVPLRNLFIRELGQPAGTFRALVQVCCNNVRRNSGEHLRLEIDAARPETVVNGTLLPLAPREHLVLLFFARRAKHGDVVLANYDECLVELNEFRQQLRQSAPPGDWSDWRHSDGLNRALDQRELTRLLSDIRAKARRAGGGAGFLACCLPEKGRCALDVPGALIHLRQSSSPT